MHPHYNDLIYIYIGDRVQSWRGALRVGPGPAGLPHRQELRVQRPAAVPVLPDPSPAPLASRPVSGPAGSSRHGPGRHGAPVPQARAAAAVLVLPAPSSLVLRARDSSRPAAGGLSWPRRCTGAGFRVGGGAAAGGLLLVDWPCGPRRRKLCVRRAGRRPGPALPAASPSR
jgi:hypothetical protein